MSDLHQSSTTPKRCLPSKTPQKRRVTMSEMVTVRIFDAKIKKEHKKELYYSARETQKLREDDVNMLASLRRLIGQPSIVPMHELIHLVERLSEKTKTGECWCIRGLEVMLDGGAATIQKRMRAVLSVLMEQDRQDVEGTGGDNDIAMQYMAATRHSQEEAHVRGLMDHTAARLAYNSFLLDQQSNDTSLVCKAE